MCVVFFVYIFFSTLLGFFLVSRQNFFVTDMTTTPQMTTLIKHRNKTRILSLAKDLTTRVNNC